MALYSKIKINAIVMERRNKEDQMLYDKIGHVIMLQRDSDWFDSLLTMISQAKKNGIILRKWNYFKKMK